MTGDFFEPFKSEILDNAVFEDVQGLWEPLWALRGYMRERDLQEDERQTLAERALRELYGDDLIYFFRVPPRSSPGEAADDPALRLGVRGGRHHSLGQLVAWSGDPAT